MIMPRSRRVKRIGPRRCEIISLMIGGAILLILAIGNGIYQNIYCGTPLDRVDFLSAQPCERCALPG